MMKAGSFDWHRRYSEESRVARRAFEKDITYYLSFLYLLLHYCRHSHNARPATYALMTHHYISTKLHTPFSLSFALLSKEERWTETSQRR